MKARKKSLPYESRCAPEQVLCLEGGLKQTSTLALKGLFIIYF
jgi:hypothetical protein